VLQLLLICLYHCPFPDLCYPPSYPALWPSIGSNTIIPTVLLSNLLFYALQYCCNTFLHF
ncbi:hypothetical protein SLEP1_g17564, partial [Rubroshorea leprosula]